MNDQQTALEVVRGTQAFLDKQRDKITKWVRGGVTAEALTRFALQEMQTNEKLRACSPTSIYLGLLACAVTGLEPGALKQEAFLIPYNGVARFMAGWRGLQKQALRSGAVKMITANVVHEADMFDMDLGTSNSLMHRPSFAADRGAIVGAYAWAQLANGFRQLQWMPLQDILDIRKFADSRGKSPAWAQWFGEMACKSAIRRIAKHIPLGEDYYNGLRIENAQDGLDGADTMSDAQIIDVLTDGDGTSGSAAELVGAAAFGALPPGKPERTPEINTKPAAAPVRPTSPPTSSSTPSATRAQQPAAASPPAARVSPVSSSTPAGSGSSKLDDAKAAVAAKNANPTAGGAGSPPPPASAGPGSGSFASSSTTSTPSTESGSPTPIGSSAERGDVAMEPGAGEAFDSAFGEDPEDVVPPPGEKTIAGFMAWLEGCHSKAEVDQGKGDWVQWSTKFPKGAPESLTMKTAFAARKAALP